MILLLSTFADKGFEYILESIRESRINVSIGLGNKMAWKETKEDGMYKGGLFKRNARQISKVIVHGIRQKQHFEVFFNGEEFAYSNVYAQLCGHSKFRVCC